MQIHWIGHACFRISSGTGQCIYFDPFEISRRVGDASLVLCSHDHHDHADFPSIDNIRNESTVVVSPKSCLSTLQKYHPRGVVPGDQLNIGGISVKAFPAYNPTKRFHPREKQWVGYIVTLEGKTVFHAGDTGLIDEFKDLPSIDIALLPVGGNYTMDIREAVEAVTVIKPKIVIPMHHWDQDLQEFARQVNRDAPAVKVAILLGNDLTL